MELGQILAAIGWIVTVVAPACVGLSYCLFKVYAEKWVESKFQLQLEAQRQEHARSQQEFRVLVESALGGALRKQEHEFRAMIETWRAMQRALRQTRWACSAFRSFVAVGRMNDEELSHFLESSELPKPRAAEILATGPKERDHVYQGIEMRRRLHLADVAITDLRDRLDEASIFLTPEMEACIQDFLKSLRSGVVGVSVGHDGGGFGMEADGWKEVDKVASPLFERVKNWIRMQLATHTRPVAPVTRSEMGTGGDTAMTASTAAQPKSNNG